MQSIEPGILRFRVWCQRTIRNDGVELADLPEPQIRRLAALALGFASVARHRVIGPWQAPVIGALGSPGEVGRTRKMCQRPCAVIVDVADEAKFAIWLE